MRSAGNFHPEWGYLAPAPSFMRIVRITLVATAIGATAGAAVVVSLVNRPSSGATTSSIAAHALVTNVQPVTPPASKILPVVAQAPARPAPSAAQPHVPSEQASAIPATTPASAPDVAQTPPLPEAATVPVREAVTDPESQPAKKLPIRKRHLSRSEPFRHAPPSADPRGTWERSRGFGPLFGLFSSRTGYSNSSN